MLIAKSAASGYNRRVDFYELVLKVDKKIQEDIK